jgi:hypothetical protein
MDVKHSSFLVFGRYMMYKISKFICLDGLLEILRKRILYALQKHILIYWNLKFTVTNLTS